MTTFQHSFDIAGPMLGGIAMGQRQRALSRQELEFAAQQQQQMQQNMLQQQLLQQQEAERQQGLFQERSARTYNMGRMKSMMGEDPALNGAMSQTMDAFGNMPASMQGDELERISKQQRQQQMKSQRDARAYPFFESLRREGFTKEAARRKALYEAQDPESLKGTSLEHLFDDYAPPVPPTPVFDPNAYAQQIMQSAPPPGWQAPMQMAPGQGAMGGIDPVSAQRLATLAQVSGQRPSAVQAERLMYPKQNQRVEDAPPDPEALTDSMMALYPDKPREEILSWVSARLAKLPVPATKLGTARTAPDPRAKVAAEQAVIDAEEEVRGLQDALTELRGKKPPKADPAPADAEGQPGFFARLKPGNDQEAFDRSYAIEEKRKKLAEAHKKLTAAKKKREEAKAGTGSMPEPGADAGGEDDQAMVDRMVDEGASDDEIKAALQKRRGGR